MADQTFQNPNTGTTGRNPSATGSGSQGFQQPASQGFQQAAGAARTAADSAKSVAEQALSDGRDLKNKAMSMAGSSTDAIKDQAAGLVDAAKGFASQAADKLKDTVDDQKNAGAEYVGSLAETMRRAAREFDKDLPIAGTYIRKAAAQVETVSDSIRTGNFNDLLRETQDFARRQPTAFLGLAVLAGFGAVRFLKSSAEASTGEQFDVRVHDGASAYRSGGGTSGYSTRPTSNEGYRDGFSK
jgi:gas vesicle protein